MMHGICFIQIGEGCNLKSKLTFTISGNSETLLNSNLLRRQSSLKDTIFHFYTAVKRGH